MKKILVYLQMVYRNLHLIMIVLLVIMILCCLVIKNLLKVIQ